MFKALKQQTELLLSSESQEIIPDDGVQFSNQTREVVHFSIPPLSVESVHKQHS